MASSDVLVACFVLIALIFVFHGSDSCGELVQNSELSRRCVFGVWEIKKCFFILYFAQLALTLASPKLLSFGKIKINFVFRSLIRNFAAVCAIIYIKIS